MVIGLEHARYDVAENASSVAVCVTVQTSVGMENRYYSVVLRTSNGGKQGRI